MRTTALIDADKVLQALVDAYEDQSGEFGRRAREEGLTGLGIMRYAGLMDKHIGDDNSIFGVYNALDTLKAEGLIFESSNSVGIAFQPTHEGIRRVNELQNSVAEKKSGTFIVNTVQSIYTSAFRGGSKSSRKQSKRRNPRNRVKSSSRDRDSHHIVL